MRANGTTYDHDEESAKVPPDAPSPPATLEVKRVDHYYSIWSQVWTYRNSGSGVHPEEAGIRGSGARGSDAEGLRSDPWLAYCFVVVRTLPHPRPDHSEDEATVEVVVKSSYLLHALRDVIGWVPGLSWTAEPVTVTIISAHPHYSSSDICRVQLDPHLLLAFLPNLERHACNAAEVLIKYLRADYSALLARIATLTAHGEITFDTVVDVLDNLDDGSRSADIDPLVHSDGVLQENVVVQSVPQRTGADRARGRARRRVHGHVTSEIVVPRFKGTVKISSLAAYPIQDHPDAGRLEKALVERGRMWFALRGIHHMQYEGLAPGVPGRDGYESCGKYYVNSRIIVDRGNFARLHPNYYLPSSEIHIPRAEEDTVALGTTDPSVPDDTKSCNAAARVPSGASRNNLVRPTDDDFMLMPTVVYGFSLADKKWLVFHVRHVKPITLNNEAFENLVLPGDRKMLLQSLVEAHDSVTAFDDFMHDKGRGLVFNLFGPPGVGKTFSAEAMSEHVRKPLYVVAPGTSARRPYISIGHSRGLRHVEYYRVKAFDEAFLSRIHVALHFHNLTHDAHKQVWTAFLKKVGITIEDLGEENLDELAKRDVNGRQIKNAVRTASSLSAKRGVKTTYAHLLATIDAVEEITLEFAEMRRNVSS
ncbi:hypothetical protein BD413DRAFT_617113 [Trametes elegans]|nr:hypothetical protein BD413DRAFT_617113 [Trametes elegans]